MIRPQTLASIARANMGQHDVLVPEFKGQHGHPVRFTSHCGDALAALQGNRGAARVVAARSSKKMPVNDAGTVMDIDTMDDLRHAREVLPTIDPQ